MKEVGEDEVEKCKNDALNSAAKYVANQLQRPDQLDKVEQLRRRVLRNKASVDLRLKTAVQSQLDGIRSGLNELKVAVSEIGMVRSWINEMDAVFVESKTLNKSLAELRLQQKRYAQLAKTNEHLKQIFNVPETVDKTRTLIEGGDYLQAHKNLMELEATRDEILFEVHQQKVQDGLDFILESEPLDAYFSSVADLSDRLAKQLWTVIERTLSAARTNPTQLVTAVRIIEREERSDRRALQQQKKTNFIPSGRPKVWKSRCLAKIRTSVNNRFDGNQLELDRGDKMWLVRHLERMRAFILEDLITVKELVQPCFPPSYEILKEYMKIYHDATSRTLEQLVGGRNDPNECVTLLSWIKDYYGEELMGNENLVDDISFDIQQELGPLLSKSVVESLNDTYLETTEKNMQNWLQKMVERESQDWLADKPPETDVDQYYQTSLPIILFQMLDQNLQVSAELQKGMELKVLDVCISVLTDFTLELQDAAKTYKDNHFADRSLLQYFEAYMISIVNNCQSITDFALQMKNQKRAELTLDEERLKNFEEVINAFKTLGEEVCCMLLEGVLLDLQTFFDSLMTKNWLTSSTEIDTIILTVEDYNRDYVHLKPRYAKYILEKAEEKLVIEYVKAIMSKRTTFRTPDDRRETGNKIIKEATKLAEAFTKLADLPALEDSSCGVLTNMAEVLRVKDPAIVSLEISGLAERYADFRAEHALALLSLRGDMGRTESKQIVADLKIRETSEDSDGTTSSGIFGQIVVTATVLDKLESKIQIPARK